MTRPLVLGICSHACSLPSAYSHRQQRSTGVRCSAAAHSLRRSWLCSLPVSAKSKARAAAAALQKETAKEQAQAMKEYKYAPRPVIEGSLETGYKYDKSTLKAGSTGELADYYRQKGAKINAEYFEEQARAQGRSAAEAKKIGAEKAALYADAEKARKTKVLSEDEKKIAEFAKQNAGLKDKSGRLEFTGSESNF